MYVGLKLSTTILDKEILDRNVFIAGLNSQNEYKQQLQIHWDIQNIL